MTELKKKVEFILTKQEYTDLITNGSITKNGITHIYDPVIEYKVIGHYPDGDEIAEMIQHIYSTAEQRVGTWINGKPLYEKTITATFDEDVGDFDIYLTELNIDTILFENFICVDKLGDVWVDNSFGDNDYIQYTYLKDDKEIYITVTGKYSFPLTFYFVIRYTKTTD